MVKVFSFTRPPQQSCVFESGPNPNGLLVLSPSYQNVVIAFPSRKVGYVTLIRLIAEGANDEKEIEAHKVTRNALNFQFSTFFPKGKIGSNCDQPRRETAGDRVGERNAHSGLEYCHS